MNDVFTAGLIVIGNEILSGRTQDANISFIGQQLDKLGIQFREVRVIPDDEQTIIRTVNAYREIFDYVFTTGGIGPTHDDITSASIAKAFNVALERNVGAIARLEKYYPPGEINDSRLKMADIPAGATLIDNPVSGAPGFCLGNVYVLAGVPGIMQVMFEGIKNQLTGGKPVLTAWIVTNLRESILAEGLAEIQQQFSEVAIGSYPFFRDRRPGVNVVMRATDEKLILDSTHLLKSLIERLGGKITEEQEL